MSSVLWPLSQVQGLSAGEWWIIKKLLAHMSRKTYVNRRKSSCAQTVIAAWIPNIRNWTVQRTKTISPSVFFFFTDTIPLTVTVFVFTTCPPCLCFTLFPLISVSVYTVACVFLELAIVFGCIRTNEFFRWSFSTHSEAVSLLCNWLFNSCTF